MVYDIVDIFMHLTLKEKEAVLKELQAIYDASVSTDAYKTPLEEAWEIVESNIYSLSREPYIDDQFEIEEIWQICEDLIRNEDLSTETWARRKRVLSDMIENGMYDYYGVWDPMNNLLKALCFTDEEWLWCADEMSNGYMKEEGAAIYREHGRPEKYYEYLENNLGRYAGPYLELIEHYSKSDPDRAVRIAELGLRKTDKDQTDMIIYLIKRAQKNNDEKRLKSLAKSAKLRRAVDFDRVTQETGISYSRDKK